MAVRTLRLEELATAEKIFGLGLDTTRVRIWESVKFPNWIGRVGAVMRRQTPPDANAVTIANTSCFPVVLKPTLSDTAWLMHELTHQWQYQHDGIRYLFEAIAASTYDYAEMGERVDDALKRLWQANVRFRDLNREQQGDVIRHYYLALNQPNQFFPFPLDLGAWDPYLDEIRQPPR